MRILIVRLSSIGDCVLASPVLEALRDRYPGAYITWAVQAKSAPVVEGLAGLDKTILWDVQPHPSRGMLSALQTTWHEHFDVALDLHGLDKAALFLLSSRARRRISGSSSRRLAHFFSNERTDETEFLHAREFYLRRASALDIAADANTRYFPRVPVKESHLAGIRHFMTEAGWQEHQSLFCINLGASSSEKTWPAANYAQIAWRLLTTHKDARVIVFGASSEQAAWLEFCNEMQRFGSQQAPAQLQQYLNRIINGVGKLSLMELAAAATYSTAFLTTDTGPMHIAAAVGAPMLAMFGPSRSQLTGPVQNPQGAPIRVLDAKDVTGSWPAPLNALGVNMVWEELNQLISHVQCTKANGHTDLSKPLAVGK